MNTIPIWISKILDDGAAYIHHEQPNKDTGYWESNDMQVVVNELFGNQLGLKAGEWMEWVMVKREDFERLVEYNAQLMEEIRKLRAANITVVQNINNNKKPKSQINITNIEDTYSL